MLHQPTRELDVRDSLLRVLVLEAYEEGRNPPKIEHHPDKTGCDHLPNQGAGTGIGIRCCRLFHCETQKNNHARDAYSSADFWSPGAAKSSEIGSHRVAILRVVERHVKKGSATQQLRYKLTRGLLTT
jgi:hypothetical protein